MYFKQEYITLCRIHDCKGDGFMREKMPYIIGSILGICFVVIAGWSNLLMVTAGIIICNMLSKKILKGSAKEFRAAFVIQGAHLAIFIIGFLLSLFITPPMYSVLVDIVILTLGLLWLVTYPGIAPVIALTIYQGITVIVSIISFAYTESSNRGSLIMHTLLRTIAIVFMFKGLSSIYKQKKSKIASSTLLDKQSPGSLNDNAEE